MKTVALIGGIGSGKSRVLELFDERGAGIVSLDAIGHEALGMPEVKHRIKEAFGAGVFDEKGEIVRARLAAAAFDSAEHTEQLNAITHPAIMDECFRRVAELAARHKAVFVEVTSGDISREGLSWADVVVAISASEALRLKRACARGEQTEEDVRRRMALQPTDEQRESIADFVIRNEFSLAELERRVDEVWDAIIS